MSSNYNIAMQYRDVPVTVEEFNMIKDTINSACRHYILGRSCIAEKARLSKSGDSFDRLGGKYGYSKSSAEKFVSFANSIDWLYTISPELAVNIIEEKIRLSMENTLTLARKEPSEVFRIVEQLSDKNVKVNEIFTVPASRRRRGRRLRPVDAPKMVMRTTIKDTPVYDPDAQMSSLSYTIPSWVSAIEKVFMASDFGGISAKARYRLRKELVVLMDTTEVILGLLKEEM